MAEGWPRGGRRLRQMRARCRALRLQYEGMVEGSFQGVRRLAGARRVVSCQVVSYTPI